MKFNFYAFQCCVEIGEDEAVSHRLYDIEVIEFSADVSFILVLPDASNVCAVPGQTEEMNPGCIVLPVQVFEMGEYLDAKAKVSLSLFYLATPKLGAPLSRNVRGALQMLH